MSPRHRLGNLVGRDPKMRELFDLIDRCGRQRGHGPDPGRKRHGQGTGGPGRARGQRPGATAPSSRSTARPCRRTCWRANSSATSRGPTPGRWATGTAASRRPTAAPSSWMRSATSVRWSRSSCCGCCRSGSSNGWGTTGPIPVDVRVVSATNRDLETLLATGRHARGFLLPHQGGVA